MLQINNGFLTDVYMSELVENTSLSSVKETAVEDGFPW